MKNKRKSTGGFTFVEMLCCVLILILLCLLANAGLRMAMKAYREITAASETRLLLGSLTDALTDRLRYAVVTKEAAGTYKDSLGTASAPAGTDGYTVSGIYADGSGRLVINSSGSALTLLPDGAYGVLLDQTDPDGQRRYRISKVEITYSASARSFTVSLEVSETSGTVRVSETFTVRCLNPLKEEGTPP